MEKSVCIALKFTVSLCCNYSFVSRLVQRFLFEEQNCLGKKIFCNCYKVHVSKEFMIIFEHSFHVVHKVVTENLISVSF